MILEEPIKEVRLVKNIGRIDYMKAIINGVHNGVFGGARRPNELSSVSNQGEGVRTL